MFATTFLLVACAILNAVHSGLLLVNKETGRALGHFMKLE